MCYERVDLDSSVSPYFPAQRAACRPASRAGAWASCLASLGLASPEARQGEGRGEGRRVPQMEERSQRTQVTENGSDTNGTGIGLPPQTDPPVSTCFNHPWLDRQSGSPRWRSRRLGEVLDSKSRTRAFSRRQTSLERDGVTGTRVKAPIPSSEVKECRCPEGHFSKPPDGPTAHGRHLGWRLRLRRLWPLPSQQRSYRLTGRKV